MSVDTRLPFSWPSIPKERSTLNFGSSSSFLAFKRESEAAKQKKHLFKVQKIKANKTFVASVTKNSHFHSLAFDQHDRMGLKGAPAAAATLSSSDDVVLKSPNDSRLYRLIHLENGLQALLVHDPEIYPEGPPKTDAMDEEEEEEDDDEEDEEDGMDEDDDEEDEDEEEASEDELEGREGGKGAANQSKKVVFLCCFLLC
jgi:nardilysin